MLDDLSHDIKVIPWTSKNHRRRRVASRMVFKFNSRRVISNNVSGRTKLFKLLRLLCCIISNSTPDSKPQTITVDF
ncbi:hypothetical protein EYC80_003161 [Monilinia laxa]|uniref:Uncharacterized protein n=1 Tax=Monilinia laxa TaxID=61186 RepID=A0A5N6KD06_MONLA|nr:hypothetical protein EYC80_003161 [Monilinia laxa]